MGKVGKVCTANKDHGPCDTCGKDILEGDTYKHTFREANDLERYGTKSQKKRTYVAKETICVLVKVHAPTCP